MPRPLREVIHTMGWPLRSGGALPRVRRSFIYPMGEEMLTIGMVVGLDYRDAALSVHDLLQELKTHPRIRPLLEGGERIAWGAKTIPEGGFVALPRRFSAPGLLLAGDGAGPRQRAGAEGRCTTRSSRVVSRRRLRGRSLRGSGALAGLRRGAAVVVRLERPAPGAEHAAGVRRAASGAGRRSRGSRR